FRFFASGRRERGLFFLALVVLFFGGIVAAISVANTTVDIHQNWPVVIVGLGVAFLITFAFERQHERGLLSLAGLMFLSSAVAFLVTLEIIPHDVIDTVADYWPLISAFIGITLIPLALRRSA